MIPNNKRGKTLKKPQIVFEDQFFISTGMTPEETEEMLHRIAHRAVKDLPETKVKIPKPVIKTK